MNKGLTSSLVALLISSTAAWGVPTDRFRGGAYDGYGAGQYRQYGLLSSPQRSSPRFHGGDYDGFARGDLAQYDAASTPQRNSPRYRGEAFDGYAQTRFVQYAGRSSPQESGPRFRGGGRDGWSVTVVFDLSSPIGGDADGDGLPDWWELLYFGGTTNAIPGDDTDGDRSTQREEWIADTHPGDSNSFFRITELDQGNSWTVTFTTSTNRVYDLERNDRLVGDDWTPVDGHTRIPGAPAGTLSLTDTNAGPNTHYRIRVTIP